MHTPCPGGTGKTFCCKDLLGDLQKIERTADARSRATYGLPAHVERLEQSNWIALAFWPRRPSCCGSRAGWTRQGSPPRVLLDKHPENPLALCDVALMAATVAKQPLPILERRSPLPEAFSGRLYEAISVVVFVSAFRGPFSGAWAPTLFQASVLGHKDLRWSCSCLNARRASPGGQGDGRGLQQCPDDVPWKAEFDEAFRLGQPARL